MLSPGELDPAQELDGAGQRTVIGDLRLTDIETGRAREVTVNGELRQHSDAGEMIFTIPESIAFLSRFVTLRPGDLLCMGTPGGVGAATETYLKAGDTVVAKIEKLGTLENKVQ